MCAHSMRSSNQILLSDKTRCEENFFTGLTTPPSWPKCLVTRMLMHNLFVVANLLYNTALRMSACDSE